jgi:hypothetical protein
MKTLHIEIPEGFAADYDKASSKVTFKPLPKKITDRVASLGDAMAILGYDDQEVYTYNRLLLTFKEEHYLLSQQAIVVITKALNEGWVPDWSKSSEYKYFPWFEMRGSSGFRFLDFVDWYSLSNVGSRLCFKSSELATYAGKTFQHLYENFMTIK